MFFEVLVGPDRFLTFFEKSVLYCEDAEAFEVIVHEATCIIFTFNLSEVVVSS